MSADADAPTPPPARGDDRSPALAAFRWMALVLAAFAIVNGVREVVSPGFSAAYLLFHVSGTSGAADACLALLAFVLLASAFGPVRRRAVAGALAAGLVGLAVLAGRNAVAFYALAAAGAIRTAWPVPLSALVSIGLLLHAVLCLRVRHLAARAGAPGRPEPRGGAGRAAGILRGACAALAAALAAVLFHIHAFGLTDYRRPADAIVVFGARAYPDGTPSEALRERVDTGVALYHAGLAPRLVLSGGVGAEGVSEPRVMRALATAAGVPPSAIVEDELGASTEDSVRSVEAMTERYGIRRVLAVSHYFHLPRIKLLAERRGIACFTVPADEGATRLRGTPFYVMREIAALAFYFAIG